MSAHEETLEAMLREAQEDYAGGDGNLAVKWAFRAARAKGRQTLAERELRNLETQEQHVYARAQIHYGDIGREMILANLPAPAVMGAAKRDVAEAVEKAVAADTMMCLLAKLPRKQPQAQQQRPPQQQRPAAANGNRR